MTVGVNPPKTPVTEGSNGVAAATIPNVCKMPGPPAPFVPTPLPNIGKSGNSPQGYSTTVKIEGSAVAIQGATFNSMGDVASQGTGGGIVSNNVQGPTSFVAPGSLDVAIEGKNVQQLGDQMLNNGGPSGSPANSATMMGTIQMSAVPAGSPRPGDPPPPCDHEWEISKPGKSPDEAKKDADARVATMSKSPSRAQEMRGVAFEPKAVDANMATLNIQAVGREYKCKKCGQEQEVDVVGDKRVAEAKSRNASGVKKKGDQARRIRDIQQKLFDPKQNPMSKVDASLPDTAESQAKFLERGFDVEAIP